MECNRWMYSDDCVLLRTTHVANVYDGNTQNEYKRQKSQD